MRRALIIAIIIIIILLIFIVWIVNEVYSLARQSGCSCSFLTGECISGGFATEDGQLITGMFRYWNPIKCIEAKLQSLENERTFMQKSWKECEKKVANESGQ